MDIKVTAVATTVTEAVEVVKAGVAMVIVTESTAMAKRIVA